VSHRKFSQDINVLGDIEVESAPTQNLAAPEGVGTYDQGTVAGKFVRPQGSTETTIEITVDEWSDMSKSAQRNFIMDEAVNRNSETVEFNGRQRRKWDTMTPTERKNELAKVRNELRLQLKIDI
jgi:hypothetical protein